MRLIDADEILCDGFREWLACVMCGRATKEHPSCDGACDMQARLYADKAADALVSWLAEVPTIEAEPVRHGHWIVETDGGTRCSYCKQTVKEDSKGYYVPVDLSEMPYCPKCGANMR